VETAQSDQLSDRLGVVVDAQIQKAIVVSSSPAAFPHDEQHTGQAIWPVLDEG
jgi:hypothetical protein